MIKCDEHNCEEEAVGYCEECDMSWCLEHCLDEDGELHCPNCGRKLSSINTHGLPNPDCFG